MEIETDQLFVYGSLRRDFHLPVHDYISQYFTYIGEGTVNGVLYDLGEYPAAIQTSDASFIKGELYKLKNWIEFAPAMEQLDEYEGSNVVQPEQPIYIRKVTKVFCNNQYTTAWIYWYNHPVEEQLLIPSGAYFDYLTYKTRK